MNNIKLILGLCLIIILAFSCKPEHINKGTYYTGHVEIPQTTDDNYGLLYVKAIKEAVLPINQPIRGIIYKGNKNFLLNETMNFEIFSDHGILFAKPVTNTNKLQLDTSFDNIEKLGLMALHIEGPESTNGGLHTKVHIKRPTGRTFNDGVNDYTEVIIEDDSTPPVESNLLIYTFEYNSISDSLQTNPNSDLYQSFESTITINSVDHTFSRLSFEHTHRYGPQN